MDTIFALATARGKAGVAVIRVSGPDAFNAGQVLAGKLPKPRISGLRTLHNSVGDVLDQALILAFESGHSFTGEDVVEFQLHGSVAGVNSVLSELSGMEGLRPAEAGEFTRRALENGNLDLAQIEGLADLLEAETESQRKQAVRVFSGHLGKKVEVWREMLIRAMALIEATIDFADEDVPVDVFPEVREILRNLLRDLKSEASGVAVAERLRDGFEIAIVGAPNVGKSTLLNYLAGRDAAITSEFAGTTRDIIEVKMDLNGIPVTFLDTAGLRETDDFVEGIGVERSMVRAKNADLRLFLVDDASRPIGVDVLEDDLVLGAKGDVFADRIHPVSGLTGLGVGELIDRVTGILQTRVSGVGNAIRLRHKVAINKAVECIEVGLSSLENGQGNPEFVAEELRSAISALSSLVGWVDVEHVLGVIFASFCIGK